MEELDFTFQRTVNETVISHLGQLDFLAGREILILLGPPGTGKTHLAIALSIRPASPVSASASHAMRDGSGR